MALPEGTDDVALASAAAAEGVVVFPGSPWFPTEAPGPFLRLTYAAAAPDALDEGVRRLARALDAPESETDKTGRRRRDGMKA
jgi:DNA-binding transcriptional MocR family regulator